MTRLQARMTKVVLSGLLLLSGVLFLVPSGFATGANLVSNPSFETLPPGGLTGSDFTGTFSGPGQLIPDWTHTGPGASGQFQPLASADIFNPGQLPSPTIAFSRGGILSQEVGTVQLGLIYTLTVDLGLRNDRPSFVGSADLELSGGGHPTVIIPATGSVPGHGDWATFTTPSFVGDASNAGELITIQLRAPSLPGKEANFDDVVLTAVPEPGTLLLFGTGLLLCGIIVHRKELRAKARNIGLSDLA